MWSSEDRARDVVRRQGRGLSISALQDKVAEAVVRAGKFREQAASSGDLGVFGRDPQELAQIWAARHVEWKRIVALVEDSGQNTYDPELDREGTGWARERERRRLGALERHEGWLVQRREQLDELHVELWLTADTSRRLGAIADGAGLIPEQVLSQLADRARMNDDGTVTVEPFTPH
ncbi:hypothetical protein [Streptomyces sp. NPDC001914]|uniref:hypothetical protein n=1 Tax=Streptomyces sp. NPDC001914 TaxID=3364623 RepID=UPI0036CB0327